MSFHCSLWRKTIVEGSHSWKAYGWPELETCKSLCIASFSQMGHHHPRDEWVVFVTVAFTLTCSSNQRLHARAGPLLAEKLVDSMRRRVWRIRRLVVKNVRLKRQWREATHTCHDGLNSIRVTKYLAFLAVPQHTRHGHFRPVADIWPVSASQMSFSHVSATSASRRVLLLVSLPQIFQV